MRHWEDITPRERIERWEQALRVLREMTPHERRKHFDMSDWGYKNECGTVACAGGRCGLDPWFRRRGFQLNFFYVRNHIFDPITGKYSPGFEGEISEARDFFGYEGAERIFMNTTHRPVGAVIREIRAYIKELKSDERKR